MIIKTYIGQDSGKMHLAVGGVTLATEGDLCRDAVIRRTYNTNVWHQGLLTHVANALQEALNKEKS